MGRQAEKAKHRRGLDGSSLTGVSCVRGTLGQIIGGSWDCHRHHCRPVFSQQTRGDDIATRPPHAPSFRKTCGASRRKQAATEDVTSGIGIAGKCEGRWNYRGIPRILHI